MSSQRPHVLTTYSGRPLDLDNCAPEGIFIDDIAAALSKICRFGAQARRFYSVAQHAVLVQRIAIEDADRRDLAMAALHHDSHEAYAGDIPSPLKAKLDAESGGVYDRLCSELDRAIAQALGFAFPAKGSADYAVLKEARPARPADRKPPSCCTTAATRSDVSTPTRATTCPNQGSFRGWKTASHPSGPKRCSTQRTQRRADPAGAPGAREGISEATSRRVPGSDTGPAARGRRRAFP